MVDSKEEKHLGTRSKYKNEDTSNMCGLRVQITYTFSDSITMAPIFISALGLTEIDIPEEPIFLIKIRGPFVGG